MAILRMFALTNYTREKTHMEPGLAWTRLENDLPLQTGLSLFPGVSVDQSLDFIDLLSCCSTLRLLRLLGLDPLFFLRQDTAGSQMASSSIS